MPFPPLKFAVHMCSVNNYWLMEEFTITNVT